MLEALSAHNKTTSESIYSFIEQKEQLYDSLFNNNIDGILVLNTYANVIDANPAMEKISGYTVEELKNLDLISHIVEGDIEKKLYHWNEALQGKPQEHGLSIINKAGKKLTLVVKIIPIRNGNQTIGAFEIIKDVTEAKRMEMMMHQSDKLSLVGELAAGVAHEIRNPLTTLKGFLDLLEPEINSTYAALMQSELERINIIVNEFLFLAKPKEVDFKPNSIKKIMNNVILLLEPQSNLKNIQLSSYINDNEIDINCDENQLKQVFINILKNAMESMPNGGNIHVKINTYNDHISIQFKDEGCGIPEEQLERLGEPFYTTKADGTGLGLLITKKIIQNHNGQLIVKSQVNKGTLVEILLPTR
ncbi:ATP-binding protein [Anaerobacillus isosaccharinicus]|uniref:histidine kinase n=1 Tax=Anaerobacillus isosaccharinicus TaxID=1532552 RepID=A0A1S2LSR8_9BACI|nr:ATP-binding protein [Anaerobacillus isosaccharinicus]MBA5586324.1 PAS domain S-box protein [Anaerobacillus isosaccharinicus]QOY35426.1 PAS domain S-box protein [Anaerobacillus isosaccharinicus]